MCHSAVGSTLLKAQVCPAEIMFADRKSKADINFIDLVQNIGPWALDRAGLLWAGQGWAGVPCSPPTRLADLPLGFQ